MYEDKFRDLLTKYPDALGNPQKLRGLLADYFPQEPMAANLLMALFTMGIAGDIAATPEIGDPLAYRYQKRLMDEYGVSLENAHHAVFTWCTCYGGNVLGKRCSISSFSASPSPVQGRPLAQNRSKAVTSTQSRPTQYNDLFQYRTIPGGLAVTGFSGSAQNTLIIPDNHQGLPIREIAPSAFAGCGARQVVVVGNLERIGARAFWGCQELRQIILPDTLREIEREAFWNCPQLTEAALPPVIQSIGAAAFAGTALKSLSLLAAVSSLGEAAYAQCPNLIAAEIPAGVFAIPDKLFFDCPHLTQVGLHNGLDTIGESAFQNCTALQTLTIPGSVCHIGPNAFADTHPKLILLCVKGSAAEQYARDHRIPFQIL